MHKLLMIGLLAAATWTNAATADTPAAAAKNTLDPAAIAAIDAVMKQAVSDRAFAGATVGVAENGRIVFIRGYGLADLELRVPATQNTVFRIGSTTKEFTAAAMMRLVEQGKASVDDPLAKYLPNFPRAKEVTLRQLLTHTSGIANNTNPKSLEEARTLARTEWTTDSMIAHIAALKPLYDFEPGTGWTYSSSGYALLGAVIEKISGKTYAQFLQSELLDPLQLRDTAVDDVAQIVPNRARGYSLSKDAPSGFANTEFLSMSGAGPAGAMRSTAADLLKWHMALLGGRVLKPASLALMTSPAQLKDGRLASLNKLGPNWTPPKSEYAFGLFLNYVDGHKSIGHGGAIPGFNTWLQTLSDDKVTLVVLSNTDYPAAEQTAPKVLKAFFEARKH